MKTRALWGKRTLLTFTFGCLLTGSILAEKNEKVDSTSDVRAIVIGDLVRTAERTLGPSVIVVIVSQVGEMDRVYKRLAGVKPLAVCFVTVQVHSKISASAEGRFDFADLGGHDFSYKLERKSQGWQIIGKSRVGGS